MEVAREAHQIASWRAAFRVGIDSFSREKEVLIVTHHDCDGLASGAILHTLFQRIYWPVATRILGRGENPWTKAIQLELWERDCGGMIVADLGTRPGVIRSNTPTVIIDHHVPLGFPMGTTVVSGHGVEPTPTTGLLAWWCAQELGDVEDLLWIAAVSIIGDMGEKSGFQELTMARQQFGITALRAAASLLNAARRSSSGKAEPALALLMKARGPKEVTSGKFPETQLLQEAREEVAAATQMAKRVAPKIKGEVALIMLDSPCQIHPLIAQQWKNRLHTNIVMVANKGYRPGWVHFSVRSATGKNLVQFLKEKAPSAADDNYGSGHEQATGGALTYAGWNEFVSNLGFGSDMLLGL